MEKVAGGAGRAEPAAGIPGDPLELTLSSGDAELFHRRCWSTALLVDVTRASPVKAVTSISLSASGGGQGTEGFYLLCVTHRVKVLETLDKQLGSIFRLESKNKINKLIFSTELF